MSFNYNTTKVFINKKPDEQHSIQLHMRVHELRKIKHHMDDEEIMISRGDYLANILREHFKKLGVL